MFLDRKKEAATADRFIKLLKIKTPSRRQKIRFLSGGNQQKAILSRWLAEPELKVVILDEPTRGIDVGAKHEIYNVIYQLAERGCAIVMISSELPEVLGVSDRIVVMRQGRIAGELPRGNANEQSVLNLALPVQIGTDCAGSLKQNKVETEDIMEVRENLTQHAGAERKNDKQKWWQQITEYSLIVIFVVMFITMSLTVDHFFSIENMLGLALSISQIGMVACTMMFCLASRDFDLSVGSTVAFAGVLCAMVLNATGNTFIAIIAAVAAGSAIGFVNGAVIAYLRINALITTLATMEVVRGLGFHRVARAGGGRVVGYVYRAGRLDHVRRVAADLGHAGVLHRVRRAAEPDRVRPQYARDRR